RGTPRMLAKLLAAACLVFGMAAVPSSAAEESPNWEGVPRHPGDNPGGRLQWLTPKATAINEVARAQQWLRLPPLYVLGWLDPLQSIHDPQCRRMPPYSKRVVYDATMYFVSTNAEAPEPFGYVGPFTVR